MFLRSCLCQLFMLGNGKYVTGHRCPDVDIIFDVDIIQNYRYT